VALLTLYGPDSTAPKRFVNELESRIMWWLIAAIRSEYRGWCGFKEATGSWPAWSILAGAFSIPVWLALGGYCFFIAGPQIGRSSFIYGVLLPVVIGGALIWYALRRAACIADISKAKRTGQPTTSIATLEKFLR
jgi:hypothetical protein